AGRSVADWRARRDRSASSSLLGSLSIVSAGTPARGARADAAERAVFRSSSPRSRNAPDSEDRQDRAADDARDVALREARRERLEVFERAAQHPPHEYGGRSGYIRGPSVVVCEF